MVDEFIASYYSSTSFRLSYKDLVFNMLAPQINQFLKRILATCIAPSSLCVLPAQIHPRVSFVSQALRGCFLAFASSACLPPPCSRSTRANFRSQTQRNFAWAGAKF